MTRNRTPRFRTPRRPTCKRGRTSGVVAPDVFSSFLPSDTSIPSANVGIGLLIYYSTFLTFPRGAIYIARQRDSLFVRAFGANQSTLINCNCGSRTAVGLLSLACPRESTQREGHPGRGPPPFCSSPPPAGGGGGGGGRYPALLANAGRETNSPARKR